MQNFSFNNTLSLLVQREFSLHKIIGKHFQIIIKLFVLPIQRIFKDHLRYKNNVLRCQVESFYVSLALVDCFVFDYTKHGPILSVCLFSNFDCNKYGLFKLYKKIAFLYKYL